MKNSKLVQYYVIGGGSFGELKTLLDQRRRDDSSYVVLVIDHYFEKNKHLDLSFRHGDDVVLYVDTTLEPRAEYIDILVEQVRSKRCPPVAIAGIGGGSAMDISKAISVLLTNPGKAEDYQGWDLVKNRAIYKIGVPTISGTGAEFTRTAVITSTTKKLGINSDQSVFDQVIMDPNLQESVPIEQFIYTAMDCFVHNVESLRGRQNDAMTVAMAQKSLSIMKEIFFGEMDREKLMVASAIGGLAVANSNVGICHPLSYGLSLVLGLHHGFSICVAFNQLEEYYPEVADFRRILAKYGIVLPKIIGPQVSDEQLERMAEATLKNERPLGNAFGKDWKTTFTEEKVIDLLQRM